MQLNAGKIAVLLLAPAGWAQTLPQSLGDTRLGGRPGEAVEFSVVGQNLATPRHTEFVDNFGFFVATEVERTVFGKITWRF